MNYNSYTMDELVNVLANEYDANSFIDASKAFVQKFVDGEYISKESVELQVEAAKDDAYQEGYDQGFDECQIEGS